MKLLLVDDEIVALNALQRRVDWLKYGFSDIYTAQDVVGARDILANNKINLVMCDIEMPGISGLVLASEIRDNYPFTECIMVTCHADFDYLKSSMKNKVRDYILKPIDYDELDEILTKYVEDVKKESEIDRVNAVVKSVQDASGMKEEHDSNPVETAKAYISEHLREKIYVEDLARLVYMNEQYFMRVFKKNTGMSITEYITDTRMKLAAELLRNTDKSISFIGTAIGSSDDAYFSKCFKKYSGMSPSEYRSRFGK